MIQMNVQIVVLGVGDTRYQEQLHQLADQYSENVSICTTFHEVLGHKICFS